MPDAPLVTLIAGPTASGKSRLALQMAESTGAVILNADSQQLYADLRVLTARPGPEDEARAEHRLYGVADAADPWSVGRWLRAVQAELAELSKAGRPAIIVGGTGLYFNALTRGLAEMPPVPEAVREEAANLFNRSGERDFRRVLAEVDPISERAVAPGDRQRLVRALSVVRATGRPLPQWKADTRPVFRTGDYEALVVEPERAALYAACDARVDTMMAQGALEEVRGLLDRGIPRGLPIMKAVGLRELGAFIRGETDLDDALDIMRRTTRNYAKRQMTWFRNQTPDWPRSTPTLV